MYNILAKPPFRTNQVHYLPTCHSTNQVAQQLIIATTDDGTIVITDHQTHGKGQTGNSWESEPGQNLTFSMILKPHFLAIKDQFYVTVVISLAIKEVLEEYMPGDVKIKWPNDILFRDKKIAGILIENTLSANMIDSTIVGIGLNVNQRNFEGFKATSMFNECNVAFDLGGVLNKLIGAIAERYGYLKSGETKSLFSEYQAALYWLKEERTFKTNKMIAGIILGTDAFGHLILKTADGQRRFQNREIQFIG